MNIDRPLPDPEAVAGIPVPPRSYPSEPAADVQVIYNDCKRCGNLYPAINERCTHCGG